MGEFFMFKILKKIKFLRKLEQKYPHEFTYIREIVHLLEHREIKILAPYIAFFILLSFIPILTLIFEVVYFTVNNNEDILIVIKEVLPSDVYTVLVRLIERHSYHASILTLSNLFLLYIASKIYSAFYTSYLLIYNIKPKKLIFRTRIISFINTLLLIILIFFLCVITIFSKYLYELLEIYLLNYLISRYFYHYVHLVLSVMIITSIVTFLMYSVPDFRQRFRDVIQGALFTTFGWIIVSFGFKLYTDYYANYENIYKTFTQLFVFVMWIYLLSYVLIVGMIINRVKITIHDSRKDLQNNNEYTEGSDTHETA